MPLRRTMWVQSASTDLADQDSLIRISEKEAQVRVFEKHEAHVWRVAIPADGRLALTTSEDGTVRKWLLTKEGPRQGEIICSTKRGFFGLAVSADGSFAAAGDRSGTIHLIDLRAGRETRAWKGHLSQPGTLAFLHGGRELLSAAADGWLRLWSAATGERISQCKEPFAHLFGVAASADGNRIVGAAVSQGLAVWSGRDGENPRTFTETVAGMAPVSLPATGPFVFTGTERHGREMGYRRGASRCCLRGA